MAVTRDDPYGPFKFLVTISPERGVNSAAASPIAPD